MIRYSQKVNAPLQDLLHYTTAECNMGKNDLLEFDKEINNKKLQTEE
ncbi:hypothetical protein SNEBB_006375, partial [Seison nebaliae]